MISPLSPLRDSKLCISPFWSGCEKWGMVVSASSMVKSPFIGKITDNDSAGDREGSLFRAQLTILKK
jgi:hypothetical protein